MKKKSKLDAISILVLTFFGVFIFYIIFSSPEGAIFVSASNHTNGTGGGTGGNGTNDSIVSGGRAYLAYVGDETVLQKNNWMQTETQFVSHMGNPSQYTMIRDGAITGMSIHCARAPVACTSNPTAKARITTGGNSPPSTTDRTSVSMSSGNNAAHSVVIDTSTTGFSAGDTISVFIGDHGTCSTQPAWCTVLVEITTGLGSFTKTTI